MLKISEILKNTDKTLFSFEVLPPVKGKSIEQVFSTIDQLLPYNPAFIEVTTHRTDYVYKEQPDGTYIRVEEKTRPYTSQVANAIKQRYQLPVVPHVICSGNSTEDIEKELQELSFCEITDLLVLRGDKSKFDNRFIPKEGGYMYASELCEQVNKHSEFSYGVAGYPEKHEEAMSMQADMDALKKKVDMGAGYIVTQMFFDNNKYFDFVDRCIANGINVPVVPGIKPIATMNHMTMLPRVFHLDLPDQLVGMLQKCKDNADVKKVGIEWAIRQCEELKAARVPSLHFYTMNAAQSIAYIMDEVQSGK